MSLTRQSAGKEDVWCASITSRKQPCSHKGRKQHAMVIFGGYIGKRQPGGSLETKKCVDKLYTLRAKQQGKGKAAQLRAASGRLVTDIEMNSTYRGAVEIFHLCRNLHSSDVLFAECIRTFRSYDLDGRSWMYRLEADANSEKMKSFLGEYIIILINIPFNFLQTYLFPRFFVFVHIALRELHSYTL